MDGTFYLGEKLIDGSLDFLQCLQRTGRQAVFLTNNSSKSRSIYLDKLRRLGVRDPFLRVYSSSLATGAMCCARSRAKKRFCSATKRCALSLSGMGVALDGDAPDYVIVGFDTTLDYAKMTAFATMVRAGLPLCGHAPGL